MAGTLRAAWGPEINHIENYSIPGQPIPTGYSIVSSPAPPQSAYAFKALNVSTFMTVNNGPIADAFAKQNYTWPILHFRADKAGGWSFGEKFGIFRWRQFSNPSPYNAIGLRGLGQAVGGGYKVALVDNAGNTNATSSTTYYSTDELAIRMEYDGTNCRVWIDGALEITYATSNKPTGGCIFLWHISGDMATVTKYYSSFACKTSTASANRPGTAVGTHLLIPSTNTSESDYGDDVDCGDSSLGDSANWDAWWAGGSPGATPYNCAPSGGNLQEVSALTTATVSDTVEGVISHHWQRPAGGSKVTDNWSRLKYDGNVAEIKLDSLDTTDWLGHQAVHLDPPGGGPWTQTKINGLELGHRVTTDNTTNIRIAAIGLVVVTLNSDPPPVTCKRRAPVQVF